MLVLQTQCLKHRLHCYSSSSSRLATCEGQPPHNSNTRKPRATPRQREG